MRKISAIRGVSDDLGKNYCELVPAIYRDETNRNAALRKSTFSGWGDGGGEVRLLVLPGPDSKRTGVRLCDLQQSQPKHQELSNDVLPLAEQ